MSHSIRRPKGDEDPETLYRDEEMNKDINDSYRRMKTSFTRF